MTLGSYIPRRVVSLQPSATVILDRLGMLDRVAACTKWCLDVCPRLRDYPKAIVADSWTAKAEQIKAQSPDLVIASVPYQLDAVAEILKAGIPFLALAPRSLEDVYFDISSVAGIMGAREEGLEIIAWMKAEIASLSQRAAVAMSSHKTARRPRVYCEEWGKPLIHSQRWVADLVHAIGGEFIGTPGERTTEEQVYSAKPDVIVAAWCGVGDRVPLERIVETRQWSDLDAVRQGRVYCIRDEQLNTPATTLVDGTRSLASAIFPEIFGGEAHGLRKIQQAACPNPEVHAG